MIDPEVRPEDIATWRQTFPELVTWSDESIVKYASIFKKEFIRKPYSIPFPSAPQEPEDEVTA